MLRKAYLVETRYQDSIDHIVFYDKEQAEAKFIDVVKDIGADDPEIQANNEDDMEELAAGQVYEFRGQSVDIYVCDVEDNTLAPGTEVLVESQIVARAKIKRMCGYRYIVDFEDNGTGAYTCEVKDSEISLPMPF